MPEKKIQPVEIPIESARLPSEKKATKPATVKKEAPVKTPPPQKEAPVQREKREDIPIGELVEIRKIPTAALKTGSATDVTFWATQSLRGVAERYTKKTFIEKYGTLLGIIFIGLLLSFVTVYTLNKLVAITNLIAGSNDATTKLNERMFDNLQTLQALQNPQPSPILGHETPVGK